MLKASIDIGSNTVLLLIADIEENQFEELSSMLRVTALGRDLDKSRVFHEESMQETFLALTDYKKELEKFEIGTDDVIVTATEASRVAINAKAFYTKIKNQLGFNVHIITSQAEAYYTAKGVSLEKNREADSAEAVILDIGGASSELIKIRTRPFHLLDSMSLPLGSVRLMNWYNDGKSDEDLKKTLASHEGLSSYETTRLICVAGTMTALAAMIKGLSHFEGEKVNGSVLSRDSFEEFVKKIEHDSVEKIQSYYPFLGKRAQTIVAGSKLALNLMKTLNVKEIEISTYGLRHGSIGVNEIEPSFLLEV